MRFVCILLLIFTTQSLFCANYGQWGIVQQYTAALVINGGTNTIRRLALFDGLTYQNSSTAAVYSSLLPISGNVNLNGGILYLDRELRFGDLVSFVGPGRIYGNGEEHDITFPGTLETWSYSYTFSDSVLNFNSDLELNSAFSFQSTCTINGNGCQIDLRGGGSFYVGSGANITFQNISLLGVKESNILCLNSDSVINLDNASLRLSGTYTFTQGYIDIFQDCKISGTGVFAYQSSQDLRINSHSKLLIDRGMTFSYDSNAASKEKLIFTDDTSTLHLNGCTLYSTRTGLRLTGGTMIIQDLVTVKNEAQVMAEAMELLEDLDIGVLGGATFDFTEGLIVYQ
jgi:hypothetical protein